jgi:hypothetical protein
MIDGAIKLSIQGRRYPGTLSNGLPTETDIFICSLLQARGEWRMIDEQEAR